MSWSEGDWIVRREVLDRDRGPWLGTIARIIEDRPDRLVSYVPEGAPFGFPDGAWPTPDGKHPWSGRRCWEGHGCLMLQQPGDSYAVWHFWDGPEREFRYWYINLQDPFRRTPIGYDTQDLELDFLVYPSGDWEIKDAEVLDERVAEGRWDAHRVSEVRSLGARIAERLRAGERWWPLEYRDWRPEPDWLVPELPDGWESV